jgi:hypothetical protein
MKEDQEIIQRLGREWGRFWIYDGIEVYHREMLDQDFKPKKDAFKIIVDKLLRYQLRSDISDSPKPFRIKGVMCHWVDIKTKEYRTGRFHTKELLPASVVEKGRETVEDWLDRFKTQ